MGKGYDRRKLEWMKKQGYFSDKEIAAQEQRAYSKGGGKPKKRESSFTAADLEALINRF